jgi:hypothetical protein
MNKYLLLLAVTGMLNSLHTTAQYQKANSTKGYYSIGNNAQKLAREWSFVLVTPTGMLQKAPPKGYYSTGNHQEKLTLPPVVPAGLPAAQRTIQKGYYSIGSKKL